MRLTNNYVNTVISDHKQLIEGYVEWLSEYRWCWFATLTFREPSISRWRATKLCEKWIGELHKADGAEDFHWFRTMELGANRDHLHFHVLIGGLNNGSKWPWVLRWNEIAGDCLISYAPSGRAIDYLLKEFRPDSSDECHCDFLLQPRQRARRLR